MTRYQRFPAGVRECRRAACKVVKEFKRGVGYCSMSCASKDGAMRVSPGAARERALKAGKAAGEAHHRRALERVDQYPTKLAAFQAGYKRGYDMGVKAGEYRGYRRALNELRRQGAA